MFAVRPGTLGPRLQAVGRELNGKLAAILVVSPHWQTPGVSVMATKRPETIHDFGGFPQELYRLQYPIGGAPEVAAQAAELLRQAEFETQLDAVRGLDHGAWVPLRYLRPEGQTPVFQVSLPIDLDTTGAARMGAALAPLRKQGVLILGSGSLTHNLHECFRGTEDTQYAYAFAEWVRSAVTRRDRQQLMDYRRQAPGAVRAHPTEEHYLPLLVAAGAATDADSVTVLEGGMTDHVLSMDSFLWS